MGGIDLVEHLQINNYIICCSLFQDFAAVTDSILSGRRPVHLLVTAKKSRATPLDSSEFRDDSIYLIHPGLIKRVAEEHVCRS